MSKLKQLGQTNPNKNEQLVDRLISGVWQERLVNQPTQRIVSYALSRGGGGGDDGHESVAVGPSGLEAKVVVGQT